LSQYFLGIYLDRAVREIQEIRQVLDIKSVTNWLDEENDVRNEVFKFKKKISRATSKF